MKKNRWLTLMILAIGGGIIFQLPFIRLMFYRPFIEAMGLTDGQYGKIASAYGTSAVVCYFLGGYIADKYSPRKLISFSFVSTGICGVYLSTFPGYTMNLILHIIMGATTVLTYWAAMLKVVGMLGSSEEQGRFYGFLEGGRGVTSALAGFIVLKLYSMLGENAYAVGWIINFYSGMSILCGILTWIFLKEDTEKLKTLKKTGISSSEIVVALKDKVTWMIGIIVFSTYVIFSAQGYLSPYFQDVYGMSIGMSVFLGIIRTYIFQFLGGPLGGIIADKMLKSSSGFVRIGFLGIVFIVLGFMFLTPGVNMMNVAIVLMLIMALVVYSMRGVYWAIVDEVGIEDSKKGTIIGVASCIGFAPDMFLPALIGNWIDKYPGQQGYNYMFIFMLVMVVIGFGVTTLLLKNIKKQKLNRVSESANNKFSKNESIESGDGELPLSSSI